MKKRDLLWKPIYTSIYVLYILFITVHSFYKPVRFFKSILIPMNNCEFLQNLYAKCGSSVRRSLLALVQFTVMF